MIVSYVKYRSGNVATFYFVSEDLLQFSVFILNEIVVIALYVPSTPVALHAGSDNGSHPMQGNK